jgi:hypothetical protein
MITATVLTGDLIGATLAGPARVDHAMTVIAGAANRLGAAFARHRGDGWQMLLPGQGSFLSAVVFLTADLATDPQALPSRIAIGLGTAQVPATGGLAGASGTAFVQSGRALDKMAAQGRTLTLAGTGTDDIQRSLLGFVEDRMARWSPEQAEVVALKLRPAPLDPDKGPTQDDIARALGISRQAVAARLQAAGWTLILTACTAFHTHAWPDAQHLPED